MIFLRNPKSLDFDRQDGNKAASTPNQKAQLWTKWRCVFVTFDRGWDADADNFIKMNASIKKRPYGVMRPVRPHFSSPRLGCEFNLRKKSEAIPNLFAS